MDAQRCQNHGPVRLLVPLLEFNLHEVRQIPEITKVIPEAELVKLCSLEQHFNHIDETLASWKRRRISRPAMNLRLTIPQP